MGRLPNERFAEMATTLRSEASAICATCELKKRANTLPPLAECQMSCPARRLYFYAQSMVDDMANA